MTLEFALWVIVLIILINQYILFDQIAVDITQIKQEIQDMSAELDALQAAVAAEATVIDSAIALITGLAAQVAAAKNDPAALTALVAEVNAKAAALADAVKANTPA